MNSDILKSDFAKIDRTPTPDEAYDEIPEWTDEMFGRSRLHVGGRPAISEDHPRIAQNPSIMMGKPVIRGTRITVELILRSLGGGVSIEEFLARYPHISRDDVLAAQAFAADYLAAERVLAAE